MNQIILIKEILFDDDPLLLSEYLSAVMEQQQNLTQASLLAIHFYREAHIRPDYYFEDWLPRYVETDFYRLFRMNRSTFKKLLVEIGKCISNKQYHGGNMPVDLEKGLLVTLWYLAKGETLRSIGDKFNIADSTVLMVTETIIDTLADTLFKKYISWPNEQECLVISEEFRLKNNYPGVIGALDGCHINCKVPERHHVSYLNRKQTHSIVLQGICTARCILTNVYIGFPGSAHDSRVLQNSSLYENIQSYGPNKYFYGTYHLLGDSAYFLRTWLITPYMDNGRLTQAERKHNFLHSSTRVVIENTFARLKGRWRILNYVNVYSIQKVIKIVAASCTLHNFTYLLNDMGPEEEVELDEDRDDRQVMQRQNDEYRQGYAKREEIKNLLRDI